MHVTGLSFLSPVLVCVVDCSDSLCAPPLLPHLWDVQHKIPALNNFFFVYTVQDVCLYTPNYLILYFVIFFFFLNKGKGLF